MKRFIFTLCFVSAIFSYIVAQEARNEIDFNKEEQKKALQQDLYQFSVTYRLQAGYLQQWQHSNSNSYPDMHLYGPEIGLVFDFNLPYNFTIQTGLMYGLTYGTNTQHWKNIENISNYNSQEQYIKHKILSHQLSVPVFVTYKVKLWRKLDMVFYTGPELSIGIAQNDYLNTNLNDKTANWLKNQFISIKTEQYERYQQKELQRLNIQYDLGGGLQWDRYRLIGGYKFGLNNLVKQNDLIRQHMWNWSVNVTFSYAF